MNIFKGTYGFDILSIFLLVISFILNLGKHTHFLGTLVTLYVLYRAFSKNIYRRSNELYKFTTLANRVLFRFGKRLPDNMPRTSLENIPFIFSQLKYAINQKMKYKIVKCPKCGQKLRLPRGQKKIIVTCKICKFEFKERT